MTTTEPPAAVPVIQAEIGAWISDASEALGLFPSVIKSGEAWSPTCEMVRARAREAIKRLGETAMLASYTPMPPSTEAQGEGEVDPYELANQLGGYIDVNTPDDLFAFLRKQSEVAALMGDEIARHRQQSSASGVVQITDEMIGRAWRAVQGSTHIDRGLVVDVLTSALATRSTAGQPDGALRELLRRAQAHLVVAYPVGTRDGVTRRMLADISAALAANVQPEVG